MNCRKLHVILTICLFSGSFFILSLQAQKPDKWADTTLDAMKSDVGRDHYIDTLLLIFNRNGDDCKWISTILYKCHNLIRIGQHNEALQVINMAESKFRRNRCKSNSILPQIYLAYCSLYTKINELSKADKYVQMGIDLWPTSSPDMSGLIRLYLSKGNLISNLDSQLIFYKKAYSLSLKYTEQRLQETSLNSIGVAFAMAGQNDSAITYITQALQIALKRNAYRTLSNYYNNLAGLSSDFRFVDNYLHSAYHYATLSGSMEDKQTTMQNWALLYYQNGKYKEGYDYLWESGLLKDSLFNNDKIKAFADMEQKYESKKKNDSIVQLQQEKVISDLQIFRRGILNYGLSTALLGLVIIAIGFYIQNRKKQKLNIALISEKQKSDDLLLNILPEEVASELKEKGASNSRVFEEVSIIFTDFINFTAIAQNMHANELVDELNYCFSGFDDILEKYGLEKIKTIGDAFLAVGNLPVPLDNFAKKSVLAAIEMQAFIEKRKAERTGIGKQSFEMRLGINVGTVVAGIVGLKKFQYDIWGDAVNTAQRLESNGEAHKVNISHSTYELVKNEPDLILEHRGKIDVKGKGEIDMYFVNLKS